jgi:DNA sulfur modification protein DndB
LFGKRAPSRKDEQILVNQYDDIVSFLNKFFAILFSVLPEVPGDVIKYVLGHEPVQNAIALYLNTNLIKMESDTLTWKEDWEADIEQLDIIDWSVKNSEWNKWTITVNPVTGSYKGFIETSTPEITEFLIDKIG